MGESNHIDVVAVLLGFSALDVARRKEFVDRLNDFMFVSAAAKRKMIDDWLETYRDSRDTVVGMIAESSAVYDAHAQRPRKKRNAKRRKDG